jgi:peptide/nickel transport system substrate-binding protein
MKNKVMNLLRASATMSIFFLAACGKGQTTVAPEKTSAPASTSASTSVVVLNTDFHLDPANADPALYPVVTNLYEGLVKEENGEITSVLAASYSSSEDGLDYIFNLRPGVTFHDGTPLNADAVIANFNRWFDSSAPTHGSDLFQAWAAAFGGFKGEVTETNTPKSGYDGIEKVDGLTVLIHLNTADADFLNKISSPAFSIVSPAVLEAAGGDGGSGPYKFASFVDADTTIKLDPFEGYWNTASIPAESMEASIK